jgi:cystathionine beta-lyase/cystathionine gamma-synthase
MPKIETQVIHAGQQPDPSTGAVMTPIYQTSTYKQDAVGSHKGYEYSRSGNPTRAALESCLASLEAGTHGLAFASGMAAIDAIVHLLEPGDHVLAADDLYGGTYRLFEKVYAQYGVEFSFVRAVEADRFLGGMRPETRLIWLETPTNPLLDLCDISAIANGAKAVDARVWVGVDSTFATPYLQRPLELGADIVQHSTTKYMGGHSDVIGGAIVTSDDAVAEQLRFLQNAIGAVPSAFDCFLVLRGIKTLAVRMDRHGENAKQVAAFLAEHDAVDRVFYPGLPSHPQFELAKRQMTNSGGMVSFTLKGGSRAARRLAESTLVFTLAESLGGVESLIEVPAAMTHASTADSPIAVDPGLVRLSVGLENVEDLIDDLTQALSG